MFEQGKNFDSFQSQIKDSVKFVKENNRTKRLMKDSPSSSSKKRTPLKVIGNVNKSPKTRRPLFQSPPILLVKKSAKVFVHTSTQTDEKGGRGYLCGNDFLLILTLF